MLLANMAKSDSIARLQSLRRQAVPALTSSEVALDQLIELFNKGANGGYNAAADYDYLGYVFADMVKVQLRFTPCLFAPSPFCHLKRCRWLTLISNLL